MFVLLLVFFLLFSSNRNKQWKQNNVNKSQDPKSMSKVVRDVNSYISGRKKALLEHGCGNSSVLCPSMGVQRSFSVNISQGLFLASLYYLSIIIMLPIYFGYPFFPLSWDESILNSPIYKFCFLFFFFLYRLQFCKLLRLELFLLYTVVKRSDRRERSNNTNGRQAASVRGRKCGSVLGAWEWRKYFEEDVIGCVKYYWLVR